jgi:hypothetical protein
VQELPLWRLTFPELRRVLATCGCTCTQIAAYAAMADVDGADTPALYSFERGEGEDLKWAVLHVWDESWPIPVPTLRSICAALELDPSIFDTPN